MASDDFERIQNVLTLPSVNPERSEKKKVSLPHDCSEFHFKEFTQGFPHIDFSRSECNDNMHIAAASIRSIFRVQIERDMERFGIKSYLEIGATVSGFINSKADVHCCLPSIAEMDGSRMLEQLQQVKKNIDKNINLRNELSEACNNRISDLNEFVKTGKTTDFVCGNKFEECTHKAPVSVASYVCPDISVETFVKGMLKHGSHTAYVSMMDAPCIFFGGTSDRDDYTKVIATLSSNGAVTDDNAVMIGGVSAQEDHRGLLRRAKDSLLLKDNAEKLLTAQIRQEKYRSLPVNDTKLKKKIVGAVKRTFDMKTKGDYDPFVEETYRDFVDEDIIFTLPGGRSHRHSVKNLNEWLHMADITPVKINGQHYSLKSEIMCAVHSQILIKLVLTKVKVAVEKQVRTHGRYQLYGRAYVITKSFERSMVNPRKRVKVTPMPDRMYQSIMSTLQGFTSVSFTKAIKLIVSNASRVVFSANVLKEGAHMNALDIYYIAVGLLQVAAQRTDDIFKDCPTGFLKNSITYSNDQIVIGRNPIEEIKFNDQTLGLHATDLARITIQCRLMNDLRDCQLEGQKNVNFITADVVGTHYVIETEDFEREYHMYLLSGADYAVVDTNFDITKNFMCKHDFDVYVTDIVPVEQKTFECILNEESTVVLGRFVDGDFRFEHNGIFYNSANIDIKIPIEPDTIILSNFTFKNKFLRQYILSKTQRSFILHSGMIYDHLNYTINVNDEQYYFHSVGTKHKGFNIVNRIFPEIFDPICSNIVTFVKEDSVIEVSIPKIFTDEIEVESRQTLVKVKVTQDSVTKDYYVTDLNVFKQQFKGIGQFYVYISEYVYGPMLSNVQSKDISNDDHYHFITDDMLRHYYSYPDDLARTGKSVVYFQGKEHIFPICDNYLSEFCTKIFGYGFLSGKQNTQGRTWIQVYRYFVNGTLHEMPVKYGQNFITNVCKTHGEGILKSEGARIFSYVEGCSFVPLSSRNGMLPTDSRGRVTISKTFTVYKSGFTKKLSVQLCTWRNFVDYLRVNNLVALSRDGVATSFDNFMVIGHYVSYKGNRFHIVRDDRKLIRIVGRALEEKRYVIQMTNGDVLIFKDLPPEIDAVPGWNLKNESEIPEKYHNTEMLSDPLIKCDFKGVDESVEITEETSLPIPSMPIETDLSESTESSENETDVYDCDTTICYFLRSLKEKAKIKFTLLKTKLPSLHDCECGLKFSSLRAFILHKFCCMSLSEEDIVLEDMMTSEIDFSKETQKKTELIKKLIDSKEICLVCDKSFRTQSKLTRHMKSHLDYEHGSFERSFKELSCQLVKDLLNSGVDEQSCREFKAVTQAIKTCGNREVYNAILTHIKIEYDDKMTNIAKFDGSELLIRQSVCRLWIYRYMYYVKNRFIIINDDHRVVFDPLELDEDVRFDFDLIGFPDFDDEHIENEQKGRIFSEIFFVPPLRIETFDRILTENGVRRTIDSNKPESVVITNFKTSATAGFEISIPGGKCYTAQQLDEYLKQSRKESEDFDACEYCGLFYDEDYMSVHHERAHNISADVESTLPPPRGVELSSASVSPSAPTLEALLPISPFIANGMQLNELKSEISIELGEMRSLGSIDCDAVDNNADATEKNVMTAHDNYVISKEESDLSDATDCSFESGTLDSDSLSKDETIDEHIELDEVKSKPFVFDIDRIPFKTLKLPMIGKEEVETENIPNEPTLSIYQEDYDFILRCVRIKKDIETGGDLFGLWQDDRNAVAQIIIGPGVNCKRTTTSFFQDVDYLETQGRNLTANGFCNIGEWHSHHGLNMPAPSYGDDETVRRNLPLLGLKRFILMIYTTDGSKDSLIPYLYIGKERIQMELNILSTKSPFQFDLNDNAEVKRSEILYSLCFRTESTDNNSIKEALLERDLIPELVLERVKDGKRLVACVFERATTFLEYNNIKIPPNHTLLLSEIRFIGGRYYNNVDKEAEYEITGLSTDDEKITSIFKDDDLLADESEDPIELNIKENFEFKDTIIPEAEVNDELTMKNEKRDDDKNNDNGGNDENGNDVQLRPQIPFLQTLFQNIEKHTIKSETIGELIPLKRKKVYVPCEVPLPESPPSELSNNDDVELDNEDAESSSSLLADDELFSSPSVSSDVSNEDDIELSSTSVIEADLPSIPRPAEKPLRSCIKSAFITGKQKRLRFSTEGPKVKEYELGINQKMGMKKPSRASHTVFNYEGVPESRTSVKPFDKDLGCDLFISEMGDLNFVSGDINSLVDYVRGRDDRTFLKLPQYTAWKNGVLEALVNDSCYMSKKGFITLLGGDEPHILLMRKLVENNQIDFPVSLANHEVMEDYVVMMFSRQDNGEKYVTRIDTTEDLRRLSSYDDLRIKKIKPIPDRYLKCYRYYYDAPVMVKSLRYFHFDGENVLILTERTNPHLRSVDEALTDDDVSDSIFDSDESSDERSSSSDHSDDSGVSADWGSASSDENEGERLVLKVFKKSADTKLSNDKTVVPFNEKKNNTDVIISNTPGYCEWADSVYEQEGLALPRTESDVDLDDLPDVIVYEETIIEDEDEKDDLIENKSEAIEPESITDESILKAGITTEDLPVEDPSESFELIPYKKKKLLSENKSNSEDNGTTSFRNVAESSFDSESVDVVFDEFTDDDDTDFELVLNKNKTETFTHTSDSDDKMRRLGLTRDPYSIKDSFAMEAAQTYYYSVLSDEWSDPGIDDEDVVTPSVTNAVVENKKKNPGKKSREKEKRKSLSDSKFDDFEEEDFLTENKTESIGLTVKEEVIIKSPSSKSSACVENIYMEDEVTYIDGNVYQYNSKTYKRDSDLSCQYVKSILSSFCTENEGEEFYFENNNSNKTVVFLHGAGNLPYTWSKQRQLEYGLSGTVIPHVKYLLNYGYNVLLAEYMTKFGEKLRSKDVIVLSHSAGAAAAKNFKKDLHISFDGVERADINYVTSHLPLGIEIKDFHFSAGTTEHSLTPRAAWPSVRKILTGEDILKLREKEIDKIRIPESIYQSLYDKSISSQKNSIGAFLGSYNADTFTCTSVSDATVDMKNDKSLIIDTRSCKRKDKSIQKNFGVIYIKNNEQKMPKPKEEHKKLITGKYGEQCLMYINIAGVNMQMQAYRLVRNEFKKINIEIVPDTNIKNTPLSLARPQLFATNIMVMCDDEGDIKEYIREAKELLPSDETVLQLSKDNFNYYFVNSSITRETMKVIMMKNGISRIVAKTRFDTPIGLNATVHVNDLKPYYDLLEYGGYALGQFRLTEIDRIPPGNSPWHKMVEGLKQKRSMKVAEMIYETVPMELKREINIVSFPHSNWDPVHYASACEFLTQMVFQYTRIRRDCLYVHQMAQGNEHKFYSKMKDGAHEHYYGTITGITPQFANATHYYHVSTNTFVEATNKELKGTDVIVVVPEMVPFHAKMIVDGMRNMQDVNVSKKRARIFRIWGPPGAGKTRALSASLDSHDFVGVANKNSLGDFPKGTAQTLHSLLINGNKLGIKNVRNFKFDEMDLLHAGMVYIAMKLLDVEIGIGAGDQRQIKFVTRELPQALFSTFEVESEVLMPITVRLPIYITTIVGEEIYDKILGIKFRTTNEIMGKPKLVSTTAPQQCPIDFQSELKSRLYITLEQVEKKNLLSQKPAGFNEKEIKTAHESQGATVDLTMFYYPRHNDDSLRCLNPLSGHLNVAITRSRNETMIIGPESPFTQLMEKERDTSDRLATRDEFDKMHEKVQTFIKNAETNVKMKKKVNYLELTDTTIPKDSVAEPIKTVPSVKRIEVKDYEVIYRGKKNILTLPTIDEGIIKNFLHNGQFDYYDEHGNLLDPTNLEYAKVILVFDQGADIRHTKIKYGRKELDFYLQKDLSDKEKDDFLRSITKNYEIIHENRVVKTLNIVGKKFTLIKKSTVTEKEIFVGREVRKLINNDMIIQYFKQHERFSCWIVSALEYLDSRGFRMNVHDIIEAIGEFREQTGDPREFILRYSNIRFGTSLFVFEGDNLTHIPGPVGHWMFTPGKGNYGITMIDMKQFDHSVRVARKLYGPSVGKLSDLSMKFDSIMQLIPNNKYIDLCHAPGVFAKRAHEQGFDYESIFHNDKSLLESAGDHDHTCDRLLPNCPCMDFASDRVAIIDFANIGTSKAESQYEFNKLAFESMVQKISNTGRRAVIKSFMSKGLIEFASNYPNMRIRRIHGSSPAGQEVFCFINLRVSDTLNYTVGSSIFRLAMYKGSPNLETVKVNFVPGTDAPLVENNRNYSSQFNYYIRKRLDIANIPSDFFSGYTSNTCSDIVLQDKTMCKDAFDAIECLRRIAEPAIAIPQMFFSTGTDTLTSDAITINARPVESQNETYTSNATIKSPVKDLFSMCVESKCIREYYLLSQVYKKPIQVKNLLESRGIKLYALEKHAVVNVCGFRITNMIQRKSQLLHVLNKTATWAINHVKSLGFQIKIEGGFFFSKAGKKNYMVSANTRTDFDIPYRETLIPSAVSMPDDKYELLDKLDDFIQTRHIPHSRTYIRYPDLPELEDDGPTRIDFDCAKILGQQIAENIGPGVTMMDPEFDRIHKNKQDVDIKMENIKIDVSTLYNPPKELDTLKPVMRTGQLPDIPNDARNLITGLNKRNAEVPVVNVQDDPRIMGAILLEEMFDYGCVEDVYDKLKIFSESFIEPDFEGLKQWVSRLEPDRKRKIETIIDETNGLITQIPMDRYDLLQKPRLKTVPGNKNVHTETKTQTVVTMDTTYSAYFAPIISEILDRMRDIIKPEFLLVFGLSGPDMGAAFTSIMQEVAYRVKTETGFAGLWKQCDIGRFDKSQNGPAHFYKMYLLQLMGMHPTIWRLYSACHEFHTAFNKILHIMVWLMMQHKSGDPTTLFGNLMVTFASMCLIFEKALIMGLFMGDDSLFLVDKERIASPDDDKILADFVNLEGKFIDGKNTNFCGGFFVQHSINHAWYHVPDPVKLLFKLGEECIKNDVDLQDKHRSYLDRIKPWQDFGIRFELAAHVEDHYKNFGLTGIDVINTVEALVYNYEKYKSLYEERETFIAFRSYLTSLTGKNTILLRDSIEKRADRKLIIKSKMRKRVMLEIQAARGKREKIIDLNDFIRGSDADAPNLVFVLGAPCSGKTTLCSSLDNRFLHVNSHHFEYYDGSRYMIDYLRLKKKMIRLAKETGKVIVTDCFSENLIEEMYILSDVTKIFLDVTITNYDIKRKKRIQDKDFSHVNQNSYDLKHVTNLYNNICPEIKNHCDFIVNDITEFKKFFEGVKISTMKDSTVDTVALLDVYERYKKFGYRVFIVGDDFNKPLPLKKIKTYVPLIKKKPKCIDNMEYQELYNFGVAMNDEGHDFVSLSEL